MLGFEPLPPGEIRGESPSLEAVVHRRLDRSAIRGWRIVGVGVRPGDLRAGEPVLLRGLVAGDVVIAPELAPDPGADGSGGGMRILVHRGDRLTTVRA